MEMRRKVLERLLAWKDAPESTRKPLLLYGARQVGKTHLVRDVFGPASFASACYVNFERDGDRVARIFQPDLDPRRIVADLALVKDMDVLPDETLVILDEAQLCEGAVSSLKYFAEDAPGYRIIATGSLFGVSMHRRRTTFPVGKVDVVRMFPLDFEEWLWACGRRRMADGIRVSYEAGRAFPLHEEALRLYREYLLVGGMPEAVARYLDGGGFAGARAVHEGLMTTYTSDIARYAGDFGASRTLELWDSIPRQLMRENRRFKLAGVRDGARGAQYEGPFAWLAAAGLVHTCPLTMDGEPPFVAQGGQEAFKAYLFDTGLLSSAWRVRPESLLLDDVGGAGDAGLLSAAGRGALAENYAMQALQANGIRPVCWRSKGQAEVDFLFQDGLMRPVPIEVKSGENVRSRSLGVFRDKYHPATCIRLSTKGFGEQGGIRSIPLYAAFCIEADARP